MKNVCLYIFIIFILGSCKKTEYTVTQIEGKQIEISDSIKTNETFENLLKPYREHIEGQLSEVLAHNVRDMKRTDGALNSSIGNMMADATMELANPIFKQRSQKNINIVLLNFGGIRSTMGAGDVNRKTAFEIMPFENEVTVLELTPKGIQEMLDYLVSENVAHPVSGIDVQLHSNNKIKSVTIQGAPLDTTINYFVATSDYLRNGGDRMYFFEEAVSETPLDYKLRNLFIDYFIKKDTIDFMPDERFVKIN
ncbi:MAG: 5'-nucleotidase C-terminal domain-containing protein [Flavobacteriaceae bacterium]|nr:5'-nucleotidase C-terminal domain-containing protein [Flavobacteriaceae bacterium]